MWFALVLFLIIHPCRNFACIAKTHGLSPETIRWRSAQIRSCQPVRPVSLWYSSPPLGSQRPPGWPAGGRLTVSPAGADFTREVWWSVSRNNTVLFVSGDVKTTKFNQYLPVVLTSFNVYNSRFQKLVMLWMWHHHGMALWRHGGGDCGTILCS